MCLNHGRWGNLARCGLSKASDGSHLRSRIPNASSLQTVCLYFDKSQPIRLQNQLLADRTEIQRLPFGAALILHPMSTVVRYGYEIFSGWFMRRPTGFFSV